MDPSGPPFRLPDMPGQREFESELRHMEDKAQMIRGPFSEGERACFWARVGEQAAYALSLSRLKYGTRVLGTPGQTLPLGDRGLTALLDGERGQLGKARDYFASKVKEHCGGPGGGNVASALKMLSKEQMNYFENAIGKYGVKERGSLKVTVGPGLGILAALALACVVLGQPEGIVVVVAL